MAQGGALALNGEELRAFGQKIRAIADDCFDMRAVERLRNLADEIDRATSVPPIILTKQGETNGTSDAS